MKFLSLLTLVGSAAAFAPASLSTKRAATALSGWKDVGVLPPAGFFDPLGFSNGKSDEIMAYYRESELKHGRVCMAACLGWYITAGGTHPFYSSYSDDPLEAAVQMGPYGWLQFIFGCGVIEFIGEKIKERPGYQPGDLLGASFWVDNSDEGWVAYQNNEITNGRLAMLAFLGIFTQDTLFGNYGDLIFNRS